MMSVSDENWPVVYNMTMDEYNSTADILHPETGRMFPTEQLKTTGTNELMNLI